jgi:hypothetical protein
VYHLPSAAVSMMGSHNDSPTNVSLTSLDAGINNNPSQNIGTSSSPEVHSTTDERRPFRHFRRQLQHRPIALLTPVADENIAKSSACNGLGKPVCNGVANSKCFSLDDAGEGCRSGHGTGKSGTIVDPSNLTIIITDAEGVVSAPLWDELGVESPTSGNTPLLKGECVDGVTNSVTFKKHCAYKQF